MELNGTSERAADHIRDELLATLAELQRRRARVARVRAWVRSPEVSFPAVVGALVAGAVVAGAAFWQLEPGPARAKRAPRASNGGVPGWPARR